MVSRKAGKNPKPPKVASSETSKSAKGQRKVVYRVRKGDTLWNIARRFKVSHNDIRDWNNLRPGVHIYPGDTLTLLVNEHPDKES